MPAGGARNTRRMAAHAGQEAAGRASLDTSAEAAAPSPIPLTRSRSSVHRTALNSYL